MGYIDTQLFINGNWQAPVEGKTLPVVNPATGKEIGRVAHAGRPDLDRALEAAQKGFEVWRDMVPAERSKIMRKAAALMRERVGETAPLLTQEQGKPLAEAKAETLAACDIIDWFAEEGFRVYGRMVPSRVNVSIRQMVIKDPVGPVAAFTPWNFPVNQVVRKISAGLAAGCSLAGWGKAPHEGHEGSTKGLSYVFLIVTFVLPWCPLCGAFRYSKVIASVPSCSFIRRATRELSPSPVLASTNCSSALDQSSLKLVLSAEMATKYFGNEDPLGQTLELRLGATFEPFVVTGVAAPIPSQSSITFDIIVPLERIPALAQRARQALEASGIRNVTGSTRRSLTEETPGISRRRSPTERGARSRWTKTSGNAWRA